MITKEITSLQHQIVKHLVLLRKERSYRKEKNRALIAGYKLISECSSLITHLFLEIGTPVPPSVRAPEIVYVTPEILKKITGLENPEPVAAEISLPELGSLEGKQRILALDGISDPGNLGTLIRSALALGWQGVFITANSTDPFNEKAVRAAKGASFRMPLQIGTHEELLALIARNKMQAIVADTGGKPLSSLKVHAPLLLILGNESHGVSQEIKDRCAAIKIPMDQMESLNVASAGAILMHTFRIAAP